MEGIEKVICYLAERGVEAKTLVSEEGTHDSVSASRVFGVELSQVAKSIVFEADGEAALVLMSGDKNVNISKLKKLLSVKKLRLAKPDFVLENTGFPVGAVCPIAHPKPVSIYVDKSLFRHKTIYPAAGTTNSLFEVELEKLLKITEGQIIDVGQDK